ncbi:hypothetical protein FB451DRAFT_1404688 [Mycena latifolia]|nr:hypothetical protein FB451DRAFT_1404688 [Mycena latifolia]
MDHKDCGVKAYAACCLADTLRLATHPYAQVELRDIFQVFFRQVTTGLEGSVAPYYTVHLLKSLSAVKSVALLVRRDLPKTIKMFLSDILVASIDKHACPEQPTYHLNVQIIVSEYSKYFFEIRIAHELVKRLCHSCPAVFPTVIPHLEEELQAEEFQLRLIVTQALAEMFADSVGSVELTRNYLSTWNMWLSNRQPSVPTSAGHSGTPSMATSTTRVAKSSDFHSFVGGPWHGEIDQHEHVQRTQAYPKCKQHVSQPLQDGEVLILGIFSLWRTGLLFWVDDGSDNSVMGRVREGGAAHVPVPVFVLTETVLLVTFTTEDNAVSFLAVKGLRYLAWRASLAYCLRPSSTMSCLEAPSRVRAVRRPASTHCRPGGTPEAPTEAHPPALLSAGDSRRRLGGVLLALDSSVPFIKEQYLA